MQLEDQKPNGTGFSLDLSLTGSDFDMQGQSVSLPTSLASMGLRSYPEHDAWQQGSAGSAGDVCDGLCLVMEPLFHDFSYNLYPSPEIWEAPVPFLSDDVVLGYMEPLQMQSHYDRIFVHAFGEVTLGARASIEEAELWADIKERIFVCGDQGNFGEYQVRFRYEPDIEADLSCEQETNIAGEVSVALLERVRNVIGRTKRFLPRGVSYGYISLQLFSQIAGQPAFYPGGIVAEDLQYLIGGPLEFLQPQATSFWNWSQDIDDPFEVIIPVTLEAGRHYHLRSLLKLAMHLITVGLDYEMSGRVRGYLYLKGIDVMWEECNPPVVQADNSFHRLRDYPTSLRIEPIADQEVDEAFDVQVTLLNAEGDPVVPSAPFIGSEITLSVDGGVGNLSGTLTVALEEGQSRVVFSDVAYDQPDGAVVLRALGSGAFCNLEEVVSQPFAVTGEQPLTIDIRSAWVDAAMNPVSGRYGLSHTYALRTANIDHWAENHVREGYYQGDSTVPPDRLEDWPIVDDYDFHLYSQALSFSTEVYGGMITDRDAPTVQLEWEFQSVGADGHLYVSRHESRTGFVPYILIDNPCGTPFRIVFSWLDAVTDGTINYDTGSAGFSYWDIEDYPVLDRRIASGQLYRFEHSRTDGYPDTGELASGSYTIHSSVHRSVLAFSVQAEAIWSSGPWTQRAGFVEVNIVR